MRSRTLKPGFFDNELLAKCKPLARILYEGLWCYSDREGRFEWRPERIKVKILPYDSANVEQLLEQLLQFGFILRYSCNGNEYGCIPTFLSHQNPHPHEKQSIIPDISEGSLHVITSNDMSLNANPLTRNRNIRNRKNTRSSLFNRFYEAYPKKRSPGQAEKAFRKLNPNEDLLAIMLDAIEQAKKSEDWIKDDGQYIPYPATWLNARGWEDEFSKDGKPEPSEAFKRLMAAREKQKKGG